MANEFKVKNGLIVSGSADIEQDLRVRGTLTVDEFHASITSSSIIYESGSTSFGNSLDDSHIFTGSVNITGSISLNGQAIGTGKLDETTFNSYTSSLSSSIGSLSSSIASTDLSQDNRLNSLESASGSMRTDFNSFTSSYITVSSSLDTRLDVLEAYSSSQLVPSSSMSFRTMQTDVYCKNTTGAQIDKGKVVRVIDSVGDNPLIALADYTSELNSANTLGITVEDIPNDSFGSVITQGILIGVNTSGMTAGALLFLGTSGSFTTTPPTAPNHGVRLGEVLRVQQNQGSILVNIDNGMELSEAHDVTYTNISSGDLLVRNGNGVWNNSKNLTGSYYITGSLNASGIVHGSNITAIETSTGSLNSFTSSINTTIKSKLNTDNIVSSSVQVTNYGFATTGSNLFIGTQTHSGSIIPSVDNTYDLGSVTHQWRDVYISSGSLYIDGTKVISSTAQELVITTDNGQSIKILEGTTDSIVLQTADGDIELKSSADGDILLDPTNGKIMLKGPIEILNGQKIQSSVGGTPVVFANDIVVSGSIDITGTIEGIDLTAFSSSLNSRLGSLESSSGNLNTFTASAINRLNALESTTSSLNTYTSSNNTRLNAIETSTGSLNSFTSSTNTRLSSIETATGSIISVNTTQNSRLDSLETTSGSILSTNTTQNGRLDSIEGKTGSYATTGSNIFIGNQTITGSLYVSQDLIIAGSSSIQHISSSVVNIADNIITVNAQNPSIRFGGLAVIDSGSSPQVSGSMLFDSTNDQWIFVHQNQTTVTSSVLLMGPQTFNNLGNESYPTTNRILKSVNAEHVGDSNITDNGTTVTILSNAVVNGTFSATGTTLVSGSSQINHNATTNYDANQHVDHTTVSITAGNGLSGGGTIASTRTLTLDTGSTHFTNGVKSKMNTDGVVSGSSQITYGSISGIPSGIVSGSSQVSYTGLSNTPSGIVSGSSQITYSGISGIPSGIVSGSVQIDLTATTNYSSGIKTRLSAEGVLSGSAQVVAALPSGTVSGSSQVSFGSISGVPSGLVSGSSQITNIANSQLTNSSFNIGTTSISLGRASASQTLSGVNIDGYSTQLNGYGNQTIHTILTGPANGPVWKVRYDSATANRYVDLGFQDGNGVYYEGLKIYNGAALTWLTYTVLHSNNYNSYSPTLTGGGASGTWGISVSGNAATVTNGVYTTGDQTISGTKTFAVIKADSGSDYPHSFTNTDAGNVHWTNRSGRLLTSNGTNWAADGRDPIMALVGSTSATTRGRMIGLTLHNDDTTNNAFSPMLTFSARSDSGNYNTVYASIYGRKTGTAASLDTNWAKGELHFTVHGDSAVSDTPTLRLTQTNATFDTSLNVNNSALIYFNTSNAYALRLDSSSSSVENDLRFAKGGTDYGAIQTNGSNHAFEFYVNTDGSSGGWQRMFYMSRDSTENVFERGTVRPGANGTQNLGTSSYRWSTVYTSDLSLSNGIGDYTIVEGEEKLYLYNNKNNKVYSFVLQEEDPATATPKKS